MERKNLITCVDQFTRELGETFIQQDGELSSEERDSLSTLEDLCTVMIGISDANKQFKRLTTGYNKIFKEGDES